MSDVGFSSSNVTKQVQTFKASGDGDLISKEGKEGCLVKSLFRCMKSDLEMFLLLQGEIKK